MTGLVPCQSREVIRKPILDPCCGSRMFYFDRSDPRVEFCDVRHDVVARFPSSSPVVVSPDTVCDVTDLPFDDESFPLVVFDPPHLRWASGKFAATYGVLPKDWRGFMSKAFAECWRVLAPNGTMVFKWSEKDVPLKDVLTLAPVSPVCGNRRPGKSGTHWLVFFKDDRV